MMVYNYIWPKTVGICEWGVTDWICLTLSTTRMKVYRSAGQFFRLSEHSSCPVLIYISQPRLWSQIF